MALAWMGAWKRGRLAAPLAVAATLAVTLQGRGTADPPAVRSLWYDEPATAFEEALPLGNGRLGATVFGGAVTERIMLNDSTLWAGGPIDPTPNPEAVSFLPKLREALFNSDYALADQLARKMQGRFSQSYAPLGDLFIETPLAARDTVTAFRRELDIAAAVARTTFTSGRAAITREYFVSSPDRVLVVRLHATQPGALAFTVRADSQLRREIRVDGRGDLVLSGRAPAHAEPNYRRDIKEPLVYDDTPGGKGMRFAARVRVVRTDGRIERGAGTLTVSGAQDALLAVAVETSFTAFDKEPGLGPDPVMTSATRLDAIARRTLDSLRDAHARDYRALFGRVALDLGRSPHEAWSTSKRLLEYAGGAADPGLEALYFQYGRYL